MGTYLLGIDIGTSACKVAVFTEDGLAAATASVGYPVYYPRPGWAEQDPDEWWEAVCLAVRQVLELGGIDPAEIAGVGIDGQSWSAVAVDGKGNVLYRTPIWMDIRAEAICREYEERIGKQRIAALCGNPLQPCYTTPKILWYQREDPRRFQRIDKILQANSFIAYRLTGAASQDLSQGYGLHCFDMKRGKWDEEMCAAFGFSRDLLPEIFPCHAIIGTVTRQASAACGLKPGTPVAAGGLDAACSALGAGVVHAGETQEQGGQAGGMSICTDACRADERLILSFHVVPGKWLLQGGTTGGGGVMRWLEREFGAYEREYGEKIGKSSLELLNEAAAAVSPGSDGLIFLPYMSGERTPIWDPKAKGVYYGIDFGKTKGHFIRAAMEGTAFALRHNLETALEAGADVTVMRSVGGAANSRLWTQIKADITGKPIVVPSSDTAAALGAAILAGVGIGMYADFDEAVEMTVRDQAYYEPDQALYEMYGRNYGIYRELYQQLKGIMGKGDN